MGYDAAMAALADPMRRRIFELVAEQPRSVANLARILPVTQPAVSHHLKVLRGARLVEARPRGASNIYHIDPRGLGEMRAWLDSMWGNALEAFEQAVDDTRKEAAMTSIKPAPVRKSVTVNAPPEQAFDVFTSRFGHWWPSSHSIGKSPLRTAIIEPRVGGRWFEIGEDGAECPWGDVLAWEPPNRILLAWRIRADWQYDPSLLTEVEIRFVALPNDATRVELEHRRLENMGADSEAVRALFDSERGWGGIMQNFAGLVAAEQGA